MTYAELIEKLQAIEAKTGLYLSDELVDLQNAGYRADDEKDDRVMFRVAADAAGFRAEEAGFDINELLGFTIY